MGGVGTGSAFKANMEALAKVRLNLRTVHGVKEPDLSFNLWGKTLAMPILGAPITGSTYNMGGKMSEEEFITEMVAGALMAGSICMTGDGADPDHVRQRHQGRGSQPGRLDRHHQATHPRRWWPGICKPPKRRASSPLAWISTAPAW